MTTITKNPDQEYCKIMKKRLKATSGYCPSSLTKLPEDKCMCQIFREQESGWCPCGYYYKEITEDEDE